MALVVIEAPGKVEAVRNNFPFPVEVVATRGHLLDLPQHYLGVEEDRIVLVPVNADHLRRLYDLLRVHDEIYIATDPDREGEVIAQQVYEMIPAPSPHSSRKVWRIRPHSLDKEGLDHAIKHAESKPDAGLALAGLTRRIVDRLIGFTLSRQAAKHVVNQGDDTLSVSIGRVKTPTLHYFRSLASLYAYRLRLLFALGFDGLIVCDGLVRSSTPLPTRIKEGWFRVSTKPTFKTEIIKPLTTARLLAHRARYGSSLESFSTYRTAQRLYEEGHITYIRTREEVITPVGIELARTIEAKDKNGLVPCLEPAYPSGGHESIRPTQSEPPDMKLLTGEQKEIYEFIRHTFLNAAAMKEQRRINVLLEHHGILLSAELESDYPYIQDIVRHGVVAYGRMHPAHGNIRLHDTYLWMDQHRVGTPATYTSSIWGLIQAGYLSPGMIVTPKGRRILEWVDAEAPWLNVSTSRLLEDLLDDVREGRKGYLDVYNALKDISREEKIPVVKKDPIKALRETVCTYFPSLSH